MKLDKFHVGNTAAGTPTHGNTVSCRRVRIGGIEINLTGTASGQHDVAGGNGNDLSRLVVQGIQTVASGRGQPQFFACDQVNCYMMFEDCNIWVSLYLGLERGLHCMSGGIGGVNDAPVAVPTFHGQVVAEFI